MARTIAVSTNIGPIKSMSRPIVQLWDKYIYVPNSGELFCSTAGHGYYSYNSLHLPLRCMPVSLVGLVFSLFSAFDYERSNVCKLRKHVRLVHV